MENQTTSSESEEMDRIIRELENEQERKADLEQDVLDDIRKEVAEQEKECDCELSVPDMEHSIQSNCRHLTFKCDLCGAIWEGVIFRK